jgi:glycerophosphoryl diester phosphodiesterase
MTEPLLIHHAANRGHSYPPNSISAVRTCLEAGARAIEIDITPLADGDFALLHDVELDKGTNGTGHTFAASTHQVQSLRYVHHGITTNEPVGLLSQVIPLIRDTPQLEHLQLDLKLQRALTDNLLQTLLRTIDPVKAQIIVTSIADWALRSLRTADPDLTLGFDPLLYLDVSSATKQEQETPPYRVGAYGYRDDHPLAHHRWGSPSDYLAARAAALNLQAPSGVTWYICGALLARALDDQFDWIAFLHAQGNLVATWTLDANKPDQVAIARRLREQGVDRITTNNAPQLALALDHAVLF